MTDPAVFAFAVAGVQYATATFADGALITTADPAHPGDTIALFGTGFGPSNPAIVSGTLVTAAEPLEFTPAESLTIAGVAPQITYAGLVESGLDQINIVVPDVVAGNQPIVVFSNSGTVSQTLMLPVAAP